MSERLQVILDDEEMREVREAARRQRMTVSDWVRSALRDARRRAPGSDPESKLAAVRAAARHAYPTADVDRMLAEIERGYGETDER